MSKNILDEFYDYDLFQLTEIEDVDGAYRTALDRLVKAEAELKKTYPDNADIFDEYKLVNIELNNLSKRNEFRKGFKVGARVRSMSRYTSEQTAYSSLKKKYVPL